MFYLLLLSLCTACPPLLLDHVQAGLQQHLDAAVLLDLLVGQVTRWDADDEPSARIA